MAAKAEKAETEKEEAAPEAPPAKKGKMVWVVLLVVVAGGAAGGTYLFVGRGGGGGGGGEKGEARAGKPSRHAGPTLPLETFIVNLNDPGGNRYLKATIELETATPPTEETKLYVPRLRDQILLYLSELKLADALKVETKAAIKKKVIELGNSVLGKGAVRAVYFKEFVMQ
jgi:flagellar FliL protein